MEMWEEGERGGLGREVCVLRSLPSGGRAGRSTGRLPAMSVAQLCAEVGGKHGANTAERVRLCLREMESREEDWGPQEKEGATTETRGRSRPPGHREGC